MRYITCIIGKERKNHLYPKEHFDCDWNLDISLFFVHIRMAPCPRIPLTVIYWSFAPSVQPWRVSFLTQFFILVQEQGEEKQPDALKATKRPHMTCRETPLSFCVTLLMGWRDEVWGKGRCYELVNELRSQTHIDLLMWGMIHYSTGLNSYSLKVSRPGLEF